MGRKNSEQSASAHIEDLKGLVRIIERTKSNTTRKAEDNDRILACTTEAAQIYLRYIGPAEGKALVLSQRLERSSRASVSAK